MSDSDSEDAGAVVQRPSRRSKRARPGVLGKLDADAATALVQRSADAEREAGDAGPSQRSETPIAVPAEADGPDRAVVDAMSAGLRRPDAAQPDNEDRRRFRRRRAHVEVEAEEPAVPNLTPDEAASAVQSIVPTARGSVTDDAMAEPSGPESVRRVEATTPTKSWRLRPAPTDPARGALGGVSPLQQLAGAEHVALRRAAEHAATEQAAARLEAEESARQAAEARLVAEQLAREHAESAAAALAARLEAEEVAAHSIGERQLADEAATEAVRGRIEAEQSAREHAARAESESTHRAVAEGQAARAAEDLRAVEEKARVALEAAVEQQEALTVALRERAAAEHMAAEHARARAEAEAAVTRLTLDRSAVEAALLRQAELAQEAMAARTAAEERALELAAALEETRAVLLQETRSSRSWPRRASAPSPPAVATDAAATPRARHIATADTAIPVIATPDGAEATINFRARRGGRVWIDGGTVHIATGSTTHRFDLTNPNTHLEMVGAPESRTWKVLFLRRSLPPYVVDGRVVDPTAFTDAVRRWRPEL